MPKNTVLCSVQAAGFESPALWQLTNSLECDAVNDRHRRTDAKWPVATTHTSVFVLYATKRLPVSMQNSLACIEINGLDIAKQLDITKHYRHLAFPYFAV